MLQNLKERYEKLSLNVRALVVMIMIIGSMVIVIGSVILSVSWFGAWGILSAVFWLLLFVWSVIRDQMKNKTWSL